MELAAAMLAMPLPALTLTLADGRAREAKTYPLGDYSCPWCGGAVPSPASWQDTQDANAAIYARQGEDYQPQPYPRYMLEVWERKGCGNPMCRMNMSAAALAETERRQAEHAAAQARRKRDHELAMERIRETREEHSRLWDELGALAAQAGQCRACLQASDWRYGRARLVRHRNPDNCPQARRYAR